MRVGFDQAKIYVPLSAWLPRVIAAGLVGMAAGAVLVYTLSGNDSSTRTSPTSVAGGRASSSAQVARPNATSPGQIAAPRALNCESHVWIARLASVPNGVHSRLIASVYAYEAAQRIDMSSRYAGTLVAGYTPRGSVCHEVVDGSVGVDYPFIVWVGKFATSRAAAQFCAAFLLDNDHCLPQSLGT